MVAIARHCSTQCARGVRSPVLPRLAERIYGNPKDSDCGSMAAAAGPFTFTLRLLAPVFFAMAVVAAVAAGRLRVC